MGGKKMEAGDNMATWYHLNLDMFPPMCTHDPYRHPTAHSHTRAPTLRIQIQHFSDLAPVVAGGSTEAASEVVAMVAVRRWGEMGGGGNGAGRDNDQGGGA